jgi:PAS domain S-box-containing protein
MPGGRRAAWRGYPRAGRPLRIEDVTTDPRVGDADIAVPEAARSWLAVPLVSSAGAFGALIAASRISHAFEVTDEVRLSELASLAGGLIHDAHKLEVTQQLMDTLERSQERYRDFAEASADWFWEQDQHLRFTWVSPGFRRFPEGQPRPYLGKTEREIEPLGVSEEAWAGHEADLRARRPFRNFELKRLNPDGGAHTISISGKPIFNDRGVFRGYRGVATDITAQSRTDALAAEADRALVERARIEVDLAARTRQQAALADLGLMAQSASDPAGVMDAAAIVVAGVLDADLSLILRLRPDGESLLFEAGLGWPDGLVGTAIVDGGADSLIGKILASGQPATVVSLANDERFQTMGLLREHGIVSSALTPILTGDRPYGLLGVHARRPMKLAEADLHFLHSVAHILAMTAERARLEHTLRVLVDDTPDWVVRLDEELRIVSANDALLMALGLPGDRVVGRTIHELDMTDSATITSLETTIGSLIRGGRERAVDLPVWMYAGERRFQVRLVPEPRPDGETGAVLAIARDITDWQRATEECAALRQELLERDRHHQELVGRLLVEQERGQDQARREGDAALIANQLTQREVEILLLLTAGLTNQQIATQLHLSPGTVRNHLGRLFPKLDAVDRTQAAVRAVELGLLRPDAS